MASGTQLIPGMLGIYSDLLQKNVSNYSNAISAYDQGQAQIAKSAPGISGAYGRINEDIQQTLGMGQVLGQNGNWGVAAPAAQDIRNTLQQTMAGNDQYMINKGFGNSTVRANMQTQAAAFAANAYGHLGAELANQAAASRERVGLAQQAAQMQTLGLQTQLAGQKGSALANYHFANTAGNLLGGYSDAGGGGGGYGMAGAMAPGSGYHSGVGGGNAFAGPGASAFSGGAGAGYSLGGPMNGGGMGGIGGQSINIGNDPYWFGAGATGFGMGGSPGPSIQFGDGGTYWGTQPGQEMSGGAGSTVPSGPAVAVGVGNYWDNY